MDGIYFNEPVADGDDRDGCGCNSAAGADFLYVFIVKHKMFVKTCSEDGIFCLRNKEFCCIMSPT